LKKSHSKTAKNAPIPSSKSTRAFAASKLPTDQEVAEAIIRTPPPLRLIDKAEVLRRVPEQIGGIDGEVTS
jgi:hypothetical protein